MTQKHIRKSILQATTALGLLASFGVTATTSVQAASFCDNLPRPAYAAYEKHPASNDWFEVYEVGEGVFALYEPFQWQEIISYLIIGEKGALLFDSGNGMGNIKAVTEKITNKPVSVVVSHSHPDHIGGNHQFDNVYAVPTPFSTEQSRGVANQDAASEVVPEALCKPLPDGLTAETYEIRPYEITHTIENGSIIDLGDRRFEVIHIPGHTDDSIALYEKEKGYMWTGDSFYSGSIWLFSPGTDLPSYRKSMEHLATYVPKLTAIFPGHDIPKTEPDLLAKAVQSLGEIMDGKIQADDEEKGIQAFRFKGYNFKFRKEDLDAVLNK